MNMLYSDVHINFDEQLRFDDEFDTFYDEQLEEEETCSFCEMQEHANEIINWTQEELDSIF